MDIYHETQQTVWISKDIIIALFVVCVPVLLIFLYKHWPRYVQTHIPPATDKLDDIVGSTGRGLLEGAIALLILLPLGYVFFEFYPDATLKQITIFSCIVVSVLVLIFTRPDNSAGGGNIRY